MSQKRGTYKDTDAMRRDMMKVYNEVYSLYGGKAGPANSAITVVYYIWQKFYQSFKYDEAAAAAVILFFIILAFTMVQKLVRKLMSR